MTGRVEFLSAISAFTHSVKVADNVSQADFTRVVKEHADSRAIRVSERVFSDDSGDMLMLALGENGGSYEFIPTPAQA